MKVKELAEELNVTRQTIYNHINDLKPDINKYIYKKAKTMYLQEPGINMIKDSLGLNQLKAMDNKLSTSESIEIITNRILKYNLNMVSTIYEQVEKSTTNAYSHFVDPVKKENEVLKKQVDELTDKVNILINMMEEAFNI